MPWSITDRVMSPDPVAGVAEPEPRLQPEVRRAAVAPLPFGLLVQGHARPQLIAIVLIALFAWGMDRVHGRAHRTFSDRVRGATLLELSTQALARQHTYLETLLASAPLAIAVIDRDR